MSVRTLIVDDEVLARRNLSSLLGLEPDFELIGECDQGEAGLQAIQTSHPDLVFLDVQMPGLNGFDVLGGARAQCTPLFVFVTAHEQFAVRAFEAQALDYLLKPFRRERFRTSLDRVRRALAAREANMVHAPAAAQSMIVKSRDRLAFVSFEALEFVRAAANYVQLHLPDSTYEVRERMAVMEARLPAGRFLRIHRSYIVNVAAIKELYSVGGGEYMLSLRSGRHLSVGPSYVELVHEALLMSGAPRIGS